MKEADNQKSLDHRIIDLLAFFISGTDVLLGFVQLWGRLQLGEDLTKEQRDNVKKSLEWTSEALMYLRKAGRDYKALSKDIELLSATINETLDNSKYDELSKATNELLGVALVYTTKSDEDRETARKIREFLLNVGRDLTYEERVAYEYFMNKSIKL